MMESFDIPVDRFYDQEHHLWVLRSQESNVVRVGMGALGRASLGHLAYVKLEGAGKLVQRGDCIAATAATSSRNRWTVTWPPRTPTSTSSWNGQGRLQPSLRLLPAR